MTLLSIDPGADTGWALWVDGALVRCGLGPLPASGLVEADRVVIEWPKVYPRSKTPPGDILKLAQCAAEIGGMCRAQGMDVTYVEPARWKGQVPKAVHHKRVMAALDEGERGKVAQGTKGLAVGKRHNVLDAVGLGLWVLKRSVRIVRAEEVTVG